MIIPISHIFTCVSGNSGITEEAIYNTLGIEGNTYKVLSSSVLDSTQMGFFVLPESDNLKLRVLAGRCGILVARNGNAGFMSYLSSGNYLANDHAYILYLKESFLEKYKFKEVNFIKWFILMHQESMYRYRSNSDNSTWNKTGFFEDFTLLCPNDTIVNLIADYYDRIFSLRKTIDEYYTQMSKLFSRSILAPKDTNKVALLKIFDIIQGHQITDEELYLSEGSIPVITGNNEIKGFWDKSIVTVDQLPCITYPTKGNPGVAYVQYELFDANNTAVLIPKNEWKEKISLEWISYKLASLFPAIATSKEGVSYLNKDIIADIELEIPEGDELIKQVELYRKINQKRQKLFNLRDKIDKMLDKHIEVF